MLPVIVRNTEREASGLVRSEIFLCCLFELVRLRQTPQYVPAPLRIFLTMWRTTAHTIASSYARSANLSTQLA